MGEAAHIRPGEREIRIVGARTHNLRNVSTSIPKNKLVGIAGVSGSGKSSLALTLAAAGQQAIASLFPPFLQARMNTLSPGVVDEVQGLTFTAVVRQKRFSKNVRSSVSTVTGIAPYLRLMFSRAATPSAGFSPSYSPNDPRGMCKKCAGLGYVDRIDLAELVDPARSLNEGAIRFPSFAPGTYRWKRLVCSGIADNDTAWKLLSPEVQELLLYGQNVKLQRPLPGYPKHGKFDGVIPRIETSYLKKAGAKITAKEKIALDRIVSHLVCAACDGQGINAAARGSRLNGLNIAEASQLSITDFIAYLGGIKSDAIDKPREKILNRAKSICEVGLGYLSLNRPTDSLSGGEAQRLRIVGLLGASITDTTFVMDEPSSGLHASDIYRLIAALRKLRDSGNTVLLVEHNIEILRACDRVIELGSGPGSRGGKIIFEGSAKDLANAVTPTGKAMRAKLELPGTPVYATGSIDVSHANLNNLKDVSASFPTGALTVVSGVAGSGKSSLITVLAEQNPQVVLVDQVPLAGSARSSLLTALDLADPVRKVFSQASKLPASWFSENGQGACPSCKGRGTTRVDMAFMDDVETICEQCGGKKFNTKTLSVRLPFGGRLLSIADVLGTSVIDATKLFANYPEISTITLLLQDVGLGYLKLGQTLNTLSGGELQRLKLIKQLATSCPSQKSVLILDEVTTGLHPNDVEHLITFLRRRTTKGFTVIAVDHNLRLIAKADHNIDLGPGAGDEGGSIVCEGSPRTLADCASSQTGNWLSKISTPVS